MTITTIDALDYVWCVMCVCVVRVCVCVCVCVVLRVVYVKTVAWHERMFVAFVCASICVCVECVHVLSMCVSVYVIQLKFLYQAHAGRRLMCNWFFKITFIQICTYVCLCLSASTPKARNN